MPDFAYLKHSVGAAEAVTIPVLGGVLRVGSISPEGPAIRSHDGIPVQRYTAGSIYRDKREVFWTRAGAIFWLQTVAAVERSH